MRIDNADRRLTPHGRRVGLINDAGWSEYLAKQERLDRIKQLLEKARLTSETKLPVELGPSTGGQTLAQILKRPEMTIEMLAPVLQELVPEFFMRDSSEKLPSSLPVEVRNELKSIETEIKYAGYLQQQQKSIERLKKAEQRSIPEWFEYRSVSGLSREMKEKLERVRPRTLGHASQIPGVTPAAVSLINVYIEIQGRRREQAAAL